MRLPTFSMKSRSTRGEVDAFEGLADVVGFEVAALAGVDLDDLIAEGGHAVGVAGGGEVADDDGEAESGR